MKAKGFTLIELLVVITIIGILATGAVSIYSGAQAKARDAQRQNDITSLASAETYYLADHDSYVAAVASLKTYLGDGGLTPPSTADASAAMASTYAGEISTSTSAPAYVIGATGMKAGNTDTIGVVATKGAFIKTAGTVGTVTVTADTVASNVKIEGDDTAVDTALVL